MRSDNVLKFTRATSAIDQSLPQPRWLNGRPSDSHYFEKQRNTTPDFGNRSFRKFRQIRATRDFNPKNHDFFQANIFKIVKNIGNQFILSLIELLMLSYISIILNFLTYYEFIIIDFFRCFCYFMCRYIGITHYMCICTIVREKLYFRSTEALKIKRKMDTKLN